MVFTEKKTLYDESNVIINKFFKAINAFIKNVDNKITYKRKTSFRSALCYGLLYTQRHYNQLDIANIMSKYRGYKTHQSSYKKRLDAVDFKIFDDLIKMLCNFDVDNFEFDLEVLSVDFTDSQIITNNIEIEKLDINSDICKTAKKHFKLESFDYHIEKDITYRENPDDIIKFKYNKSGNSINVPILGVYNVTRHLPVSLELVKTKNERNEFLNFYNINAESLKKFKNKIMVFDRGYPSYKMFSVLIDANVSFIIRLPYTFKFIDRKNQTKKKNSESIKDSDNQKSVTTDTKKIKQTFLKSEIDEIKTFYYNHKRYFIRYINCQINGIDYKFATNLLDKITHPINIIKDLYHKRWSIEEYFKLVKEKMKLERYTTKSSHSIQLSLYMDQIMTIILGIFKKAYMKAGIQDGYSVNNRSMLTTIYNQIIPELLKEDFNELSEEVLLLVANTVNYIPIKDDRHFARKSKTTCTKWYYVQHSKNSKKANKSINITKVTQKGKTNSKQIKATINSESPVPTP